MGVILLVMFVFFGTHLTFAESKDIEPEHIVLPDGKGGIGFDDMEFASGLGKVLIPGGRTGNLYLIDPKTLKIEIINGFSIDQDYHGGHGQSITSADEGSGMIFIADRDTQKLHVLDPKTKIILALASLAGKPDYVRYIKSTHEVWVTQPSREQIEVFNVSKRLLSHEKFITILDISKKGEPVLLGVEKAANGSHCVTGDSRGNIWVCDPQHGQLLMYKDRFSK